MQATSHAGRPLRVVQWTTGRTGSAAVAAVLSHPRLELVGCYAYSAAKVGRDVGELCGLDSVGIAATDDVGALLALAPDCVVYTAYRPDIDHLERILGAGINVVTTLYMLSGEGYGEQTSRRLRAAAARGGASLYASGVYPGHAPMVALSVSAMCRRIDRLSVLESLDVTEYANAAMFTAMGFGGEPDDPRVAAAVEASCGSFKDQVRTLARALEVDVDDVRFSARVATADAHTNLGFMTIDRGRVAGIQGSVAALVGGRSVIECRFVWKLGSAMTPRWPVTDGYVIEIEGDPGVRCTLPVVNAIAQTCAAPPGIVNEVDLFLVRGAGRVATG
jgi:2,4-diaminopentanoate dehydrogenase